MLTTRFSVHLLFYSCRQTLVKALQSSVVACSCIFTFVLFNFFLRRIVVGGGEINLSRCIYKFRNQGLVSSGSELLYRNTRSIYQGWSTAVSCSREVSASHPANSGPCHYSFPLFFFLS